jgi:hypothetical protein
MSDFGHMAGQLARLGQLQERIRAVGDVTSESGHVRRHLIDGPKSTEELEQLTGLTGKQIWGRLKWDMQQGRVRRTPDLRFELVEVDADAIQEAVKLLRRSGYTVTKNKARTCRN